jgi:Tfp pilus assembly protein PilF
VELSELVRGAQEAMDRGNYHLAARACTHALESFPDCMSAHRMLGEALLERGETEPAIGHFERALALDPLSVVARLGLGVAAEERKDPGLAYAHYLHAWEINPALDQVRGQLVRLRAQLGSVDRLHPTRAGLAGIHARSGQFGRAAAEWRAILAVDPDSLRARTSLAEVLWRAGDDAGAAAICREILRTAPDNARALAMLADIEKRVGAPSASDWISQYRAIDPVGELVPVIGELREGADLSFLVTAAPSLPDFDFETASAEPEPVAVPATPSTPSLAASHVAAPDLWDNLVRDLQHDEADTSEPEAGGIQPFSWSDEGPASDFSPTADPFSLEGLQDLDEFGTDLADPAAAPVAPAVAEIDLATMESGPSVVPAPDAPAIERIAPAATSIPGPATAPPPRPAEPGVAPLPMAPVAPPAAPNPFVTADGRVDLTVGWDEIDRALQAATPSEESAAGYEDLLAELDAGGLAPFSADDGQIDNGAWEPFTADEFDAAPVPATEPPPVPALVDEAADGALNALPWSDDEASVAVPDDWVDIDEDLIAAIPSPQPSGYTELLRHVDNEALVPLEAPEAIDVDPFANPDASGDPLGIEDLLTVTSRDGTAPLGPVESKAESSVADFAVGTDLPAFDVAADAEALPWADATQAPADDLADLVPFNLDDVVAGTEATGSAGGVEDLADLDEVFAPVPFAVESSAEQELASAMPEPEAAPADMPVFDWAEAIGEEETPAVTPATVPGVAAEADNVVRWPTFVSHTSELIDRESSGLFDRLRAAKQALIAEGRVVVQRSLTTPVVMSEPPVDVDDAVPQFAARPRLAAIDGEPVALPVAPNGIDLTAMRVRLIESESAAAEIASTLEAVIGRGDTDPLALRVLGEAYLRLGRTEQAAAQFRQAMLARRRAR